jgi:Zn ribbon nucleic-acid-binding protein
MKLYEFEKHFPSEEKCKMRFKEIREQQGIECPKCKGKKHYWKTSKEVYQCVKCGYRQSLKAGTVMHSSKLSYQYWFVAMHLLTATKNSFSAAELQRQLGHKRYQPIWELSHKIRSMMGKRDAMYVMKTQAEFDVAFFTTEVPEEQKNEKRKAGAGSQRKTKVAETRESLSPKKGQKPTKVKYIKMQVVEGLNANTIAAVATNSIDSNAKVVTDDSTSHVQFKNQFKQHQSQIVEPKDIGKVLPWVHISIVNAKSLLADIHHGIKPEFLQNYLNEFCYKFNRRYFGEDLFNRLLIASASYKSDFEHRVYSKIA